MICNRRTFFAAASGLALGTRMATAKTQGANDRVRVGVIGTGGRARGLMNHLKRLPGNELVAVCDVYEPRMLQAAEIGGASVTKVADYRRILDDRGIDAVVIGTPDHWHKTITLDAVAAGKDVYVEKPVSHTIAEGAEMVKVIEASKQIVQTGTQQRSWEHWVLGKEIIDSGRLGQITFVQTYWYQHARAGNYMPVAMDKLDWARWLGPAADQPFRPERFYQWRHYWDFGGGCLTDLMTHWIDVVHWYMDVDARRPPATITTSSCGRPRIRSRRRSSSRRTSWHPTSAPTSARSTTAGSSSAATAARSRSTGRGSPSTGMMPPMCRGPLHQNRRPSFGQVATAR